MKKRPRDPVAAALAPCRREIDSLDSRILKLLARRYAVVRKVARIKIKNDILVYQGARVEAVKTRNATEGKKYGIDAELVRSLYTLIIAESHAIEDRMRLKAEGKQKTSPPPPRRRGSGPREAH